MNLTPQYAERVARALAEACNGGSWQTHYTEQQRDVWRARVAKMKGENMTYDSKGRRIIKTQDAEIEALRREVRRLREIVDKARKIIEDHDRNQLTKENT